MWLKEVPKELGDAELLSREILTALEDSANK